MNGCTLYPPNSQLFTDDVIGSVVQRAWMSNERIEDEEGDSFDRREDSQLPSKSQYSRLKQRVEDTTSIPVKPAPSMENKKTRGQFESFSLGNTEDSVVIKPAATGEERQRELRRMRQVRYRKKKYDLARRLEEGTNKLREEVNELELRRRAISVASVADSVAPSDAQLNFLLSNMSEDVVFNSRCGAEAIMQVWRCQSLWLKDFELELRGLNKHSGNTLKATMTTSFIVSNRTLEKVFPHLSDKNGDRSGIWKSRIANALLGRRIIAHGSTYFEWDPVLGRVSSMTTQADLLTPVLRLLGYVEDVAVVFEKAIVSPDFHWKQVM
ncbi:hypothetical protein F442_12839 [Phytophthora nicotianae P10297]|uniref:BZIP domain-containing protein n=1 Tax=Phytophthora nicotianae P10297 TaxID=1317064 RepID=W2Z0M8_PHYNI|nr:hypothetical protein F442_12839 [Phytophthora nicotianae P10297]